MEKRRRGHEQFDATFSNGAVRRVIFETTGVLGSGIHGTGGLLGLRVKGRDFQERGRGAFSFADVEISYDEMSRRNKKKSVELFGACAHREIVFERQVMSNEAKDFQGK